MLSPTDVASAYAVISKANPPQVAKPASIEFLDLPLLRSVDPRQHDCLAQLVRLNPAWEHVKTVVAEQRDIRKKLYRHLLELDAQRSDAPEGFEFPDPYSLLLWIWTFQLFEAYLQPREAAWKKYYYRGEAMDYGATRFQPLLMRPDTPHTAWQPNIPARSRALIQNYLTEAVLGGDVNSIRLARYSLGTMSCAQALAVAQHYRYPTPLTDVTTHPDIAMSFATSKSTAKAGVIGCWDVASSQEWGKQAVIVVPSLFRRVHLQSGYFICSPRKTSGPAAELHTLRFKHCPEVEPVRPTWLRSIGAASDQANEFDILEDPLDLVSAFKGEWPYNLSNGFPSAPPLSTEEIKVFARLAAADIMLGAGRQGMEKGRRFVQLHYPVLYSMTRHAPVQTYQYADLLRRTPDRAFEVVLQPLITVYRIIIGLHLLGSKDVCLDNHVNVDIVLEATSDLDNEQIMQKAAEVVAQFDNHAVLWPLNTWYESGVAS
jgi:hypothetical protein